ncbi:MAG: alpha/beta fold hydrolase [Phycisphaerales bacterium]|nr:alpha/beta fold hydrolase [Phycisphaerales bacterium]
MLRWILAGIFWGLIGLTAVPASAAMHQIRIPLHDGQLSAAELSDALLQKMHLPALPGWMPAGSIPMTGIAGNLFVKALDQALGDGFDVQIQPDALIIMADPQKLPRTFRQAKSAVRIFTETAAPDATAEQRRTWGLLLPADMKPDRTLVVLVHGLDCNRQNWQGMSRLLQDAGYQVGYFSYPSDEPIDQGAHLLAQHMIALRQAFPSLRVNLIGHSMGGLVCRDYVEGDQYAGGIDHLILIAPPNQGSSWASYRLLAEAQEHFFLWRNNPDWHWTWMITDGLGEAGVDLKPDSEFLAALNARPRRAGVRYTIIAGNQSFAPRIAADLVKDAGQLMPQQAMSWWAAQSCTEALDRASNWLSSQTSDDDGPVSLQSSQLTGVGDVVILPADHSALYQSIHGREPAAWKVIRDRLGAN